jgi:drug/metabolite transporter (DMT)-like permease
MIFNNGYRRFTDYRNGKKKTDSSVSTSSALSNLTAKQLRLLILRLSLGYPGWLMLNYTVLVLPLGICQTIQNLIPFMVLAISYFTLHETLKVLEIVNMCISFLSVLFIIYISSTTNMSSSSTSQAPDEQYGMLE